MQELMARLDGTIPSWCAEHGVDEDALELLIRTYCHNEASAAAALVAFRIGADFGESRGVGGIPAASSQELPPPRDQPAEPGATPSDLVSALNHPLRRSMLRLLTESGPASAKQMTGRMSYVTLNNVRSHLNVLAALGMARKEHPPGSRASVYSATDAPWIPWVATVLLLTAEEDCVSVAA